MHIAHTCLAMSLVAVEATAQSLPPICGGTFELLLHPTKFYDWTRNTKCTVVVTNCVCLILDKRRHK